MVYELLYWPAADDHLAMLEADPTRQNELRAVERTLSRLAEDPYDPRLGTTAFRTEQYGGINATPVRGALDADWYVLWQRGAQRNELDIVAIVRIVTARYG
jgi:hypothetical protein